MQPYLVGHYKYIYMLKLLVATGRMIKTSVRAKKKELPLSLLFRYE